MKKILLLASLTLAAGFASAYDINALEGLIKQKNSLDPIEAQTTNLMLHMYYRGIAETLSSQPSKDGQIYVYGLPVICLSKSAEISVELVQAMAETEIKKNEFYQKRYGSNWKNLPAPSMIFLGLARAFPCAQTSS